MLLTSEPEIDESPFYRNATVNVQDEIYILTGLHVEQFDEVFVSVENVLTAAYGGRGRKAKLSKKDKFLLTLTWIRHNDNISRLARDYSISASYAQTIIAKTSDIIYPVYKNRYIHPLKNGKQLKYGISLKFIQSAALIAIVRFYQSIDRLILSMNQNYIFLENITDIV